MPDRPHIQLDDELEALYAHITAMGGLVEEQLAKALEAMSKRDSVLAEEVIARDNLVNLQQQEIDMAAALALALRQPVSRDLREIIATIKISGDLERIGDLAKNVAKRTLVLNQEEPVTLTSGLVRMGREVLSQIKDVLDAYNSRSVTRALEVWTSDDEIDELYNSLLREFLTYMMEDPRVIGLCTHLLFIAKNLERAGDHATNIAEMIYYIDKGEPITNDRPKGTPNKLTDVKPKTE